MSLATRCLPHPPHPTVTTETVSRHCHTYPGGAQLLSSLPYSTLERPPEPLTCEPSRQQRHHSQKSIPRTPWASGLRSLPLTLRRPRLSFPCLLQDWRGRHGEPTPRPAPAAPARPTSAHGPILPQGVAGRAGAHVGALGVVAAEGAEQGVQGALVHVWGGQCRCRLGRVSLRGPQPRPQAPPPSHSPARGQAGRTLAGHHGARLEAVGAGTFEASDDVSAGAFAAGVPGGALVCVWGGGRGPSGPAGGLRSSLSQQCPVRPPHTAAGHTGPGPVPRWAERRAGTRGALA